MAVKTLTITEEVYNSLSVLKQQNESFSQLFLRLSKGKARLSLAFDIAGIAGAKYV
ncbi:MAG: antitoxin VapB family protein [Nanoarchaeota archaeon]